MDLQREDSAIAPPTAGTIGSRRPLTQRAVAYPPFPIQPSFLRNQIENAAALETAPSIIAEHLRERRIGKYHGTPIHGSDGIEAIFEHSTQVRVCLAVGR